MPKVEERVVTTSAPAFGYETRVVEFSDSKAVDLVAVPSFGYRRVQSSPVVYQSRPVAIEWVAPEVAPKNEIVVERAVKGGCSCPCCSPGVATEQVYWTVAARPTRKGFFQRWRDRVQTRRQARSVVYQPSGQDLYQHLAGPPHYRTDHWGLSYSQALALHTQLH